jgi:hypothetical protein
MKKCEDFLQEYGIDFIDNEKIPKEVELHFMDCPYCAKELNKQKRISKILEKNIFYEEIPKIEMPPVLRKRDKIQFLFLSTIFFFFFLFYHSILNSEFFKPYLLIIYSFGIIPSFKLNIISVFIIILLTFSSILILIQLKKLLKKL